MKITVSEFESILKKNPIIPCTRDLKILTNQEYDKSKIMLLHDFSIFDLYEFIKLNLNEKSNKYIIFSLETMRGISSDEDGIGFVKKFFNVSAIEGISPRTLSYAKKIGLITIQTIFAHDSKAVAKAINLIKELKPDYVDIRPGITLAKFNNIAEFSIGKKIICSGLINSKKEIDFLLNNGALAITTSKSELWKLYY